MKEHYSYVYSCNIPEELGLKNTDYSLVELRIFAKNKRIADKVVDKINAHSLGVFYNYDYTDKSFALVMGDSL